MVCKVKADSSGEIAAYRGSSASIWMLWVSLAVRSSASRVVVPSPQSFAFILAPDAEPSYNAAKLLEAEPFASGSYVVGSKVVLFRGEAQSTVVSN